MKEELFRMNGYVKYDKYEQLFGNYKNKYDILEEISDYNRNKWYGKYDLDYPSRITEPKETNEERTRRLRAEKILNRDKKIDQILGNDNNPLDLI